MNEAQGRYTLRWSDDLKERVRTAVAKRHMRSAQDAIFEALDEWLPRQLAGAPAADPIVEHKHVCPHCSSITYAGCTHTANALVRDSVPKTEQKLQNVKNGIECPGAPSEIVEAATSLDLGPFLTMLVRILRSGDEDAPDAIKKNLRSFFRLVGGDPDVVAGPDGTKAESSGGGEGSSRIEGFDPVHDSSVRKKKGRSR